jgi:hypothetical protein
LAPPSPLRENLPPNLMNYTTIYSSNPRSATSTPINMRAMKSPLVASTYLTPRTMTLYAFGESPSVQLEMAGVYISNNRQNQ